MRRFVVYVIFILCPIVAPAADSTLVELASAIRTNNAEAFASILKVNPGLDLTRRVAGESLLWLTLDPDQKWTAERQAFAGILISREFEILFVESSAKSPRQNLARLLFLYDDALVRGNSLQAQDIKNRVSFLLRHGQALNPVSKGNAALSHYLADHQKWNALSLLISEGIDIDGLYDWTLYSWASSEKVSLLGGQVRLAIAEGDDDKADAHIQNIAELLKLGASPEISGGTGSANTLYGMLFSEMLQSHLEPFNKNSVRLRERINRILKLFAQNGLNWSAPVFLDLGHQKRADNVLTAAVRLGLDSVVRQLLDQGADVNVRNSDGQTPLMVAVINKNLALADLLISRGADINARNMREPLPTALHVAIATLQTDGDLESTIKAIDFLIQKGADIDFSDRLQSLTSTIESQMPRKHFGMTLFSSDGELIDKYKILQVYLNGSQFARLVANSKPIRNIVRDFHHPKGKILPFPRRLDCSLLVSEDRNRLLN